MSRDLIIGNWKMHATHLEAIQMVQKLSYRLESSDHERVEVVVAPPTTALRSVQTVIEADHMRIGLAAQSVHFAEQGAFTGEVSAAMLAKLSVDYVIVGHSERRAQFSETNEIVNQNHLLLWLHRIPVHFHLVNAIFQAVGYSNSLVRQFALFANRHETG